MRYILISFILLTAQVVFGQRVDSSCETTDSIIKRYRSDADRMLVRRTHRQSLSVQNDPNIPKPSSDTILNALIAVYNATSLPARDSVVSIFGIHTFPYFHSLNRLNLRVDSTLPWAKNLRNKILPCQEPTIDSIIQYFNLEILYGSNIHKNFYIGFVCKDNYNMQPIVNTIESIKGVVSCSESVYAGDGNDITDSIYTDHVELNYSFGWEDCMAGCGRRRYWKFNVYSDCSVEFEESYGDYLGYSTLNSDPVILSPNPFTNSIEVSGLPYDFTYSITNSLGKEIDRNRAKAGKISNLENLNTGIYYLTIEFDNKVSNFKIVKE